VVRQRRLLVTGGSGFLGTNVVDHFTSAGWDVRNVDVRPPRDPAAQKAWLGIDILDRDRLIDGFSRFGPDAVIHLAARTDLDERADLGGYAPNVEGVRNVVGAIARARSVTRAIFASSQLAAGDPPDTLYGRSKLLGEQVVRDAAGPAGAWTIVRPTSLWGPWFGVPFRDLFRLIGRGMYVHPAGITTLKQWGFAGNAAYQLERLLDAPADAVAGRTFYLADYEPLELYEFVDAVRRALGARRVPLVPAPILAAASRLGDIGQRLGLRPPLTSFRYRNLVTNELADVEPLRRITGPLPYSPNEGIDLTVGWLREWDN
jgi:nucleoside-diphosphate-sugar epimerase